MGLFVHVIKPLKKLSDSTDYNKVFELYDMYEVKGDDITFLYNQKEFKEHLKEFTEGLYLYDYKKDGACLTLTYGYYNDWRNSVVDLVEKNDFDKGYFKEFYWFTDCDGCFDYKIAEKLLQDFNKYLSKAKETFNAYDFDIYQDYIKILEECVDCKGIVLYR